MAHLQFMLNNFCSKRAIIVIFTGLLMLSCSKDNPRQTVIELDLKKNYPELYSTQFIESWELIPLETTQESVLPDANRCLFGFSKESIFIYNKLNKSISVFFYNGEIEYVIKRYGQGPMEYTYPVQLLCNRNDQLLIVDRGQKVIVINPGGQPAFEVRFQNRLLSWVNDGSDSFYAIELKTGSTEMINVVKISNEFEIINRQAIDSICLNPRYYNKARIAMANNQLLVFPYPVQNIFQVHKGHDLRHLCKLDLGSDAVSENDDLMNDLQLLNTKAWIMKTSIIKDWLFITGGYQGVRVKAVNLKTNSIYNVSRSKESDSYSIVSQSSEMPFNFHGKINDETVFGIVTPEEVIDKFGVPVNENSNFFLQIGYLK
ncbi:MAG: 6-bladed beta-propeller [Bacteroidales bacterium]|nr:6-bladed beta-propeller [Bacteroidales bacterium]